MSLVEVEGSLTILRLSHVRTGIYIGRVLINPRIANAYNKSLAARGYRGLDTPHVCANSIYAQYKCKSPLQYRITVSPYSRTERSLLPMLYSVVVTLQTPLAPPAPPSSAERARAHPLDRDTRALGHRGISPSTDTCSIPEYSILSAREL